MKFLSVKTIVIPPANTGNDSSNNTAVTTTAHPNKANLCSLIPGLRIFRTVVMTSLKVVIFTQQLRWTISSAYLLNVVCLL